MTFTNNHEARINRGASGAERCLNVGCLNDAHKCATRALLARKLQQLQGSSFSEVCWDKAHTALRMYSKHGMSSTRSIWLADKLFGAKTLASPIFRRGFGLVTSAARATTAVDLVPDTQNKGLYSTARH